MLAALEMVSVDDVPGAGLGLNVPVAPAGRPLTLKLTALLNPLSAAMLTV